jgi:cation transport ATPase
MNMTSEKDKSCKEKPSAAQEETEEKRVMVTLAITLSLTIIVASALDLIAGGIPLGFIIPLLNETATISRIIYYVMVIAAATYIGYIGLRELFVERRFSVEFLMAVAALGAIFIGYFFEAAMVLLLYCIAEYFEGYIQERARKTVEKLSQNTS